MTDYVPTLHRGFETIEKKKQNMVRTVTRKEMQNAEKG